MYDVALFETLGKFWIITKIIFVLILYASLRGIYTVHLIIQIADFQTIQNILHLMHFNY